MKRIIAMLGIVGVVLTGCSEKIDNTGTCSDGIRNQGEQAVDCGGPCPAVCASCADGIRNQGETAVDCGGPCDPCYPRLSATISTVPWSSTSRNAFISGPGTLRIYGTNQVNNITLYYSGPFTNGSVSTGAQFTGELRDELGNVFTSVTGGQITFSTFDTTLKTVSGVFTFTGTNTVDGTSKTVANGVFNELTY